MAERKWRPVDPPPRNVSSGGDPRQHPANAGVSPLSWHQIEWAHKNNKRFLDPHYDANGVKCPKCFPPRKTRSA